jgi:hypothetical protein
MLKQMFTMKGTPSLNSYAAQDMAWQVLLTDRRVAFWSPQHNPVFGGPKEKAGIATGGHCAYTETKQINLNAQEGGITIICEIDRETTLFTQIDDEPETLSTLANLLAAHIENWLSDGRTSITDEALAALKSYDFASATGELDLNIMAGSSGKFTIIPVGEGIEGISYSEDESIVISQERIAEGAGEGTE